MASNQVINEIQLKVTADARSAVAGLKPLSSSLDQLAVDAKQADAALDSIGTGTKKVNVDDSAVSKVRAEITRLRAEIKEATTLDVNADTKAAKAKLADLQRTLKVISDEPVVVEATVEVDSSALSGLQTTMAAVRSGFSSGLGSAVGSALGPLAGNLFKVGAAGEAAGAGGEAAAGGIAAAGGASVAAATGVGAIVVALGAIAVEGVKAGQAAADVQTSVTQLGALTGNQNVGEELFADLQKWAATTPFAIDDATEATKRLLAAGVQVGEINDQLTDMGNIASATGAPLSQIATIFGQMQAKGKLSTEDVQQLTDLGIPAWQTLADAMGLTVEQVQELTTQGKLGADSIDTLRESLAGKFPTAMSDQAKTFNGQMSTFHDTLDQVEANLGTIFLPLMTDVLGIFNNLLGPVLAVSQGIAKTGDWLENKFGIGFLSTLPSGLGALSLGLDALNGGLDDNDEKADKAAESTKKFNETIDDLAEKSRSSGLNYLADRIDRVAQAEADAAAAAEDHAASMKTLNDRVQNTADAYDELLSNLTSTNDAMIESRSSIYDYEGALDDLAKSLADNGATFSPDSEEGRKNWDKLVSFAEAASNRVETVFKNRGAAAADKVFESQRDALHQLLTDAGVGADQAWALVNQVFKKPINMKIKLDQGNLKRLDADLEKLRKKRRKIIDEWEQQTSSPMSADAAERLGANKDAQLKPLNLQIKADLVEKDKTMEELDSLTKDDRGKNRKAQVDVVVPQREIDEANRQLDGIIKLRRTAKIQVELVPPSVPLLGDLFNKPFNTNPSSTAPTTPAVPQRNKFSADIFIDGRLLGTAPGRLNQRGRRRVA